MRRIFSGWIFDVVVMVVGSYEGKPVPDDQVASKDMRNIGNVGSGSDNVQCDSRSNKMTHHILDIEWEGDEVPGGIGTSLVDSKSLIDRFLAQRCFVRRI